MLFKKQAIAYKELPLTKSDSTITFSGTFSERSLASICTKASLPSLLPLVSARAEKVIIEVGSKSLAWVLCSKRQLIRGSLNENLHNMGPSTFFGGGIDAELAWDITWGSASTVIAVLDTGLTSHPEFADRLLPGYDFISEAWSANDGNGRDADPSDPGDWVSTSETAQHPNCPSHGSSWHGTHVTGIIAAKGNNGIGIAGVNWTTKILPVRVLGKCGGNPSDITDGMLWADTA